MRLVILAICVGACVSYVRSMHFHPPPSTPTSATQSTDQVNISGQTNQTASKTLTKTQHHSNTVKLEVPEITTKAATIAAKTSTKANDVTTKISTNLTTAKPTSEQPKYFIQTRSRLNQEVVVQNISPDLQSQSNIPQHISRKSLSQQPHVGPNLWVPKKVAPSNKIISGVLGQMSSVGRIFRKGPKTTTLTPQTRMSDVIQGQLKNSNSLQISLVAPSSRRQDKFLDTRGNSPIIREIVRPKTGILANNDAVFGSLSFGENQPLSMFSNPKSDLTKTLMGKKLSFNKNFGGFVVSKFNKFSKTNTNNSANQGGSSSIGSGREKSDFRSKQSIDKTHMNSNTAGWVTMDLRKRLSVGELSKTNESKPNINKSNINVQTSGQSKAGSNINVKNNESVVRGHSSTKGVAAPISSISIVAGNNVQNSSQLLLTNNTLLKESLTVNESGKLNDVQQTGIVVGGTGIVESKVNSELASIANVEVASSVNVGENDTVNSTAGGDVSGAKQESLVLNTPNKQPSTDGPLGVPHNVPGTENRLKVAATTDITTPASTKVRPLNIPQSNEQFKPKFKTEGKVNVFRFGQGFLKQTNSTKWKGALSSGRETPVLSPAILELGTQTPAPTRALASGPLPSTTAAPALWEATSTAGPVEHLFFTIPMISTTPKPWSSLSKPQQQFNRNQFKLDFHRNFQKQKQLLQNKRRFRMRQRGPLSALRQLINRDPYLAFAFEFEKLYRVLKPTTPFNPFSEVGQNLMASLLEL